MKNKNFCYKMFINCMIGSTQRPLKISPSFGLPV